MTLIDPRQARAAALLMTAVDLPVPLRAYSAHLGRVGKTFPSLTAADVVETRRTGLEAARALIDEMLAEMPAPTPETP